MPKTQSRRRDRNRAIIALWDAKPAAAFTALGLTAADLKTALGKLQGTIVMPGDPTYDQDRMLSNPVFDPAPSMIVYCVVESDVAIALGLAQHGNVPFTVRSGGHCTAGFSGGNGVMIDVSRLNHIVIDKPNLQANVGAGCNFGALNTALEAQGVHVPAGECDDVCVGGYVQGGGIGFTSATYGMNCDNVIEMRVMLQDGSIVTANASSNHALWWAMRGGTGGNFGILLSVTYQLYPLGRVMGFSVAWDLSLPGGIAQAVAAMALMESMYMGPTAPWRYNLTLQALVVWQNIIDPNGIAYVNPVPVFMIRGLYVGDMQVECWQAMEPIVALPGAVVQFGIVDYYNAVLNSLLGAPQDQPIVDPAMGMPNEDKASRYVSRNLTPAEWTSILTFFVTKANNTMAYMYLEFYGGKIADATLADSAFIHRDAHFNAVLDVFWYKPSDRLAAETFLNGWVQQLEKVWNNESYQNYASINVPDYAMNYWGAALKGLWYAKQAYDPGYVFTFAQQIPMVLPVGCQSQVVPAAVAASLALPIDYSGGIPPVSVQA